MAKNRRGKKRSKAENEVVVTKLNPVLMPRTIFDALCEYTRSLLASEKNVCLVMHSYPLNDLDPKRAQKENAPEFVMIFLIRFIENNVIYPIGAAEFNWDVRNSGLLYAYLRLFLLDLSLLELNVLMSVSSPTAIMKEILKSLTNDNKMPDDTGEPIIYSSLFGDIIHTFDLNGLMQNYQRAYDSHQEVYFFAYKGDLQCYRSPYSDIIQFLELMHINCSYNSEGKPSIQVFMWSLAHLFQQAVNEGELPLNFTSHATNTLLQTLSSFIELFYGLSTMSPNDLDGIYDWCEDFRVIMASSFFKRFATSDTQVAKRNEDYYKGLYDLYMARLRYTGPRLPSENQQKLMKEKIVNIKNTFSRNINQKFSKYYGRLKQRLIPEEREIDDDENRKVKTKKNETVQELWRIIDQFFHADVCAKRSDERETCEQESLIAEMPSPEISVSEKELIYAELSFYEEKNKSKRLSFDRTAYAQIDHSRLYRAISESHLEPKQSIKEYAQWPPRDMSTKRFLSKSRARVLTRRVTDLCYEIEVTLYQGNEKDLIHLSSPNVDYMDVFPPGPKELLPSKERFPSGEIFVQIPPLQPKDRQKWVEYHRIHHEIIKIIAERLKKEHDSRPALPARASTSGTSVMDRPPPVPARKPECTEQPLPGIAKCFLSKDEVPSTADTTVYSEVVSARKSDLVQEVRSPPFLSRASTSSNPPDLTSLDDGYVNLSFSKDWPIPIRSHPLPLPESRRSLVRGDEPPVSESVSVPEMSTLDPNITCFISHETKVPTEIIRTIPAEGSMIFELKLHDGNTEGKIDLSLPGAEEVFLPGPKKLLMSKDLFPSEDDFMEWYPGIADETAGRTVKSDTEQPIASEFDQSIVSDIDQSLVSQQRLLDVTDSGPEEKLQKIKKHKLMSIKDITKVFMAVTKFRNLTKRKKTDAEQQSLIKVTDLSEAGPSKGPLFKTQESPTPTVELPLLQETPPPSVENILSLDSLQVTPRKPDIVHMVNGYINITVLPPSDETKTTSYQITQHNNIPPKKPYCRSILIHIPTFKVTEFGKETSSLTAQNLEKETSQTKLIIEFSSPIPGQPLGVIIRFPSMEITKLDIAPSQSLTDIDDMMSLRTETEETEQAQVKESAAVTDEQKPSEGPAESLRNRKHKAYNSKNNIIRLLRDLPLNVEVDPCSTDWLGTLKGMVRVAEAMKKHQIPKIVANCFSVECVEAFVYYYKIKTNQPFNKPICKVNYILIESTNILDIFDIVAVSHTHGH